MSYILHIVQKRKPTSASSGEHGEVQELFELLDQFCSNVQLSHLIRLYRPSEADFPVTGNRDELLSRVRKLFNTRHIKREKLDRILERAEENGRQHIFLYEAADDRARAALNDFEGMESVFLGGKTRESASLPKFQIHPNGVEIADFRQEARPKTKYSFWTYKLYAGSERWEKVNSETKDDEKIVTYRLKYKREVVLLKWHSFGLLEIRIPTGSATKQLAGIRSNLLSDVIGAIRKSVHGEASARGSFATIGRIFEYFMPDRGRKSTPAEVPYGSLAPVELPVKKLDADARSKEIKWIGVRGTDYDLDGHRVRVETDDEDENLYQNRVVVDALKKVTDCTRLEAVIHLKDQRDAPEKLLVDFAPGEPNEFVIRSNTSPEGVEFIVRAIWERLDGKAQLPPSPVDSIVVDAPKTDLERLNFDDVAERYPHLANAMMRLKQWVSEHPSAGFLDPARLQHQLGTGLHGPDVAVAIAKLMEEGLIERKYRIRPAKRKAFLPEMFDSLDDVLDTEIKDQKGEVVDLQAAEVVPVYGKAGSATT